MEVCSTIKTFFTEGKFPSEMNETVVALVPKVPHPESISQLRLICCCNYFYKIISKIIVTRLKGIMCGLISPDQSAFVAPYSGQPGDFPGGFPLFKKKRKEWSTECCSEVGYEQSLR